WQVTIIQNRGFEPLMDSASCWFWVCEDMSNWSGTFSITYTGIEQVSLCTYKVLEGATYAVTWDGCRDEGGGATQISVSGTFAGVEVGEEFTLGGNFQGCLHKGTGGNNYVTQVCDSCTVPH
ncbi:unnamed protein product, partial [marine sediment metagenome]